MVNNNSQKKTLKTVAKKREYNNTKRAARSKQTEKQIIESLVALLVQRKGGEIAMDEVAAASGISERTIFRFFKDKKALHVAMNTYLLSYLQNSAEQMRSMSFIGFAKNAYKLFDAHEDLTTAYLFSTFGQDARILFRKKLNKAMIEKIRQENKIELTPKNLRRLALVTSLVNAKIWFDIKTDFGFQGEDMTEAVEWAMTTLLKNI